LGKKEGKENQKAKTISRNVRLDSLLRGGVCESEKVGQKKKEVT